MGRYELKSDILRNRLYVKLDGYFTDDETREAVDKVIMEVNKLSPGFAIINDISKFKPASPKGVDDIRRAVKYVADNGMRMAIRIAPSSYFAGSQFSRISRDIGYTVETVASLEEAEEILHKKV